VTNPALGGLKQDTAPSSFFIRGTGNSGW
jgi:hypothetical protein